MKPLSGLLPYALASIAVLLASAIALVTTVRPISPGPSGGLVTFEPAASARATPSPADARMAYWRTDPAGVLELWTSDLSGDHRTRIAAAEPNTDIALTHWSPDGSAVGFTIGGTTLGMAWLDGTSMSLPIPVQLRSARWKIVSFEWSPDARRVAITLRAAGGLSNESDIYVAETRGSATWERVTTLGDAFAGRWIDSERLFVETASGMISVLDLSTKTLRPITALQAASPIVARDGRVYFVGGRFVTADVVAQPLASGWVWSATLDGSDVRRETSLEQPQARLFGIAADGRAVTGVPGGVYLVSDAQVPLAFLGAGTVRRVVVSDDGKRLIGITDSRILQIDMTKIPRDTQGALPSPAAATTLISGLRDADVWMARRAVALASSIAPSGGPRAKLAFTLGRTLWVAEADGTVRQLFSEPVFFISPPRWSPAGDRVAVVVTSGGPASASLVIASAQGVKRSTISSLGAPFWSPDGKTIAMWAASGTSPVWTTQLYAADTGVAGERIAGRALLIPTGRIVLSDGDLVQGFNRVFQRIELLEGADRRTITDAVRISGSALLRDQPDASRPPLITEMSLSADRAYLGLQFGRLLESGSIRTTHVVVRVSDGEVVYVVANAPQSQPSSPSWSTTGHLLGWDVSDTLLTRSSLVIDPVTSQRLLSLAAGRFAGWSPDGAWVYTARDEGLFAYRIDGKGDPRQPFLVGPFGTIVAAAAP